MFSCQKNVKDNSERKYITFWLNVLTLCQANYLWSYISRSPASKEKVLLCIYKCAKPVVHYHWLHRVFASKHYILRFQVSVHNPLTVKELKSS